MELTEPQLPVSLHDKIIRKRDAAARYAAFDAGVAATAAYLAASGHSLWLVAAAVIFTAALALDSRTALRAQQALNLYRRNPAVAYIAEVRNAFGPQS